MMCNLARAHVQVRFSARTGTKHVRVGTKIPVTRRKPDYCSTDQYNCAIIVLHIVFESSDVVYSCRVFRFSLRVVFEDDRRVTVFLNHT